MPRLPVDPQKSKEHGDGHDDPPTDTNGRQITALSCGVGRSTTQTYESACLGNIENSAAL